MKKTIIVVLVLGAIGGALYYLSSKSAVTPDTQPSLPNPYTSTTTEETSGTTKTTPEPTKPATTSSPKPTTSGPKTFTMAEVATHNSEASCYSAIGGNVYDLTSFISEHPGGDRNILKICGKDGTSAFEGQHGGQYRPEQILAGLQIGILK